MSYGRRAATAFAAAVLAAAVAPCAAGASPSAEPKVRGPTRSEAWVARIVAPARGYARAGGTRVIARLGVTARWAGGPNRLLVLAARHDAAGRLWLRVRLARRPNNANAWIRADRTVLKRTRWRVEIDVGDRFLTVFRANRILHRFRAVVGAPATPTPMGRFAIAEIVPQPRPSGFLGPWALHLTAHSDVLDDYGGGPGTVAIHGRGGSSLRDPLGSARSHGCIRIDNRSIRYMARRLVPGTPVTIRH